MQATSAPRRFPVRIVGAVTDLTVGASSLAILATATSPLHTAVGVVLAVLLLTRTEAAS
jgi:hypothetical protein